MFTIIEMDMEHVIEEDYMIDEHDSRVDEDILQIEWHNLII